MPVTAEVVRVLEVDPDLGEALDPENEALARAAAVAHVAALEPGEWRGREEYPEGTGHLGLLILDGLLARTVELGTRSCVELLGPGDFLRPWVTLSDVSSVPIDSHWTVVERTRVAVLDRRFASTMARFPEIASAVLDRVMARSRSLAFYLAVGQLKLVEERVLVVLWHLADRWGRVRPDGVALRLPITQKLLGGVVGARRPSVTAALSSLRREGQVERLPNGDWLLHGDPPEALGRIATQAMGKPLQEDGAK